MLKKESLLIHGSNKGTAYPEGAVNMPIYQSSVFESHKYKDVKYIRFNNVPNQTEISRKIANIEGLDAAVAGASGMAVITAALLTVLKPGDRLLAQRVLYGGTLTFLKDELTPLGIGVDFVDGTNHEEWTGAYTKNTKAFYCEAMTNPLIEVADLNAISQFCEIYDLVSIIDNTFATPVNYLPGESGFNLVLHSATKFLNGFSDISAGVISGSKDLIARIRAKIKQYGAPLDPNSCYLFDRGLKTLSLRIHQQNANALELARFLEDHPKVKKVRYPGLKSSPDHERASTLFSGFGGMLSFEFDGNGKQADKIIRELQLITAAPSLGGVESLIMRPAAISHSVISPEERREMGITDELIRISVGIEHIDDLKEDLDCALNAI